MSGKRTGSQQTISKQRLEKVKLLKQENRKIVSNTQTVRKRSADDRNVVISVFKYLLALINDERHLILIPFKPMPKL